MTSKLYYNFRCLLHFQILFPGRLQRRSPPDMSRCPPRVLRPDRRKKLQESSRATAETNLPSQ
jgi:hypothetical protein